jgi:uncharacterized protein YndB with AHSA1/START domain
MKAQESITLSAAPEKVWPYLFEPEKVRLWCSTYQKFVYAGEQHSGPGTRFDVEEKAGGPLMKYTFEATEWEECKKLTLNMISGTGVKAYQQTLLLEPQNGGSRFTFGEEVELPMGILGKIIGFLGEGMSRSTLRKMLAKLKTLVEA